MASATVARRTARTPDERHGVDDASDSADVWEIIIGATLGPPATREHPQTLTLADGRNLRPKAKSATSRQQRQGSQRTHNPSVGGSNPARPIPDLPRVGRRGP